MKNKLFPIILILILLSSLGITYAALQVARAQGPSMQTQTAAVQAVGSDILADGSIHSQNEAVLHFQTGGKLTYLSVKEGDSVFAGQTIAQLDTYALQRQLTTALNSYRSTRDTFDQAQSSSQNGNLQGQQKFLVETTTTSKNDSGDIINDTAKRILDQNQATLDNSVINVELASYALQLSTLTSPINGIITHEDVTIAGQNITPITSFSVADPKSLVFRANVSSSDIDFVSVGANVKIRISGQSVPISGTVVKIYPQKQTLQTGQEVYLVDIQSEFGQNAKLGQTGSVLISSNAEDTAVTVPTWTVLNHTSIWVEENGKAMLKFVTVGKIHGDKIEITSGLTPKDRVITNPMTIASQKYQLL